LDDIADGIGDALERADTVVLGGNLSDGGELSITTTVLGSAFAPLRRSGARPGDHVYVTGSLGGVAQAIDGMSAGTIIPPDYRSRFAAPVPRIAEARWLADRGA